MILTYKYHFKIVIVECGTRIDVKRLTATKGLS
jgi:hypothetical protein